MVFSVVAYTAVIQSPALVGAGTPDMSADHAAAPQAVVAEPTRASSRRREVDPDAEVVGRAAGGDLVAFEQLVWQYQTRVVNYATAILRASGEAEAVAQETFIRAHRALHRFRGDSSFKTWLYTIATNLARTALERRSRRERIGDQSLDDEDRSMGALDVPAGGPDAESALVTRDAIDRALSALPDTLREAVVLLDVEGLDYKEIAVVIDAPIGTVESRIFRGRQRLRSLLAPLRAAPGASR